LVELTLAELGREGVLIRVHYSSINYKDALAATGKGAILRRFPLFGGIDLAGEVVESNESRWRQGDRVLCCGAGLSETENGGYAEYVRVDPASLVAVPSGLELREAMIIGTAGLTAALAIDRMELNGLLPHAGPVLVTGATGGVGSLAIDLLAGRGYEVVAFSGKSEAAGYLRRLGAGEVLDRHAILLADAQNGKPLEKARFRGAIDNLGGAALGWLLKRILPGGTVAAIGLAAGSELETTVLPFILRGVSLLGINSVVLSQDQRDRIWQRLAGELKPRRLDTILSREIALSELPAAFEAYIGAAVTGRTIVRVLSA
jgi:putative YhdH/YhfP family quinone oxidoreductase